MVLLAGIGMPENLRSRRSRILRAPHDSDRISCSRFCGRCQTPDRVPPLARRLAGEPQTAVFHPLPNTPSKAFTPPQKGEKCNLCVRYDLLPMSRVAQYHLQALPPVSWSQLVTTL